MVRWFVVALTLLLFGYALIGRSVAYLGYPPLFVGEMVFAFGLFIIARSRAKAELFRQPVVLLIVGFGFWSAMVTLPYIPVYGLDALRDGVLWAYAAFALATAAVMMEYPALLRWLLLRFRTHAWIFLMLAWAMYVTSKMDMWVGVRLPGSNSDIIDAPGGELLVHLSGVAAFIAVGMVRKTGIALPMLFFNLAVLLISKRAGMLAFMAAFLTVIVMKPPRFQVGKVVYAATTGVLLLVLINPRIDIGQGRELSLDQLRSNVVSTFDSSSNQALETTKSWRTDWWGKIIGYTFGGEYALLGKGYGINLASDDGFQVLGKDQLRSPHNATMNVLARSGVLGVSFWLFIHGAWAISMLRAAMSARKRRLYNWHGIFVFLLAYFAAIHVNASFDVFLESPIGGIWLWSLMGFGIAAVHLYNTQPQLAEDSVAAVVPGSSVQDNSTRHRS